MSTGPAWECEFETADTAATQALAERLGRQLRAGDLLVLTGELGAGKTTFTQGLGAGMGVRPGIISPTFVLVRIHPNLGDGPDLVHVDAYRLGSAAEIDDVDLENTMDTSVTVVEWGAGRVEHLSDSRLEVELVRATGADEAAAGASSTGARAAGARSTTPGPDFDDEFDDEVEDRRVIRLRAFGPRWAAREGRLDLQ